MIAVLWMLRGSQAGDELETYSFIFKHCPTFVIEFDPNSKS